MGLFAFLLSGQTWRNAWKSLLGWYPPAKALSPPAEALLAVVDDGGEDEAEDVSSEVSGRRVVAISAAAQRALLLYCALNDFEHRLQREVGKFEYKDSTIAFGERLGGWRCEDQQLVKRQAANFKAVTRARHWLFHHTAAAPDVTKVLAKMGDVLAAMRGIAVRNSTGAEAMATAAHDSSTVATEWPWASVRHAERVVAVELRLSTGGMCIPMPEERCLVGRAETIEAVTKALLAGSSARVLVHGLPGMGKDVVAAEVVRSAQVAAACFQLQAWLQASTDAMLRQQLLDLFKTQLPRVVAAAGDKEEDQLVAIRLWLERNDSWLLVVEDAGWASRALWEYIPSGSGRLLVTSQAPLSEEPSADQEGLAARCQTPLEHTIAFELEGLSVSASLELLRRMGLFSSAAKNASYLEECCSEMELQYICNKVEADAEYLYAPADESKAGRKARHEAVVATLLQRGGEKAKARKLCHRLLVAAQQEYRGLVRHSGFRRFLSEELGNVPLSVALCGHLLRSIGSVDGVMERHRRVSLRQIDSDGRNPMTDRHFLGVTRSVLLLVQRMVASGELACGPASRLLCCLALLPSKATPLSLFRAEDSRLVVTSLQRHSTVPSGGDPTAIQRYDGAVRLLERFGLATKALEGWAPGVHQQVQRVVREMCAKEDSFQHALMATRSALQWRIEKARVFADYKDEQALSPCAEYWCSQAEKEGRELEEEELRFHRTAADSLSRQGSYSRAAEVLCRVLEACPTEEQRFSVKTELADVYYELGKMHEAARLREEVLEFSRQAGTCSPAVLAMQLSSLSSSLLSIGKEEEAASLSDEAVRLLGQCDDKGAGLVIPVLTMAANCKSAQGKYGEAVLIEESLLKMASSYLQPHDPRYSTVKCNLAISYNQVGRPADAARLNEELLEIFKQTLALEHPRIAHVMSVLASSYHDLDMHEKALSMKTASLELRKRALPPGHRDIAKSMNGLVTIYVASGRHREAAALQEEALWTMEQLLPAGHSELLTSKFDLAYNFRFLGRHDEELRLRREILEHYRSTLPPDQTSIAQAMAELAHCFTSLGQHDAAAALQEEAAQRLLGGTPALAAEPTQSAFSTVKAMKSQAAALAAAGKLDEAASVQEQVLQRLRHLRPPGDTNISDELDDLARTYIFLNRRQEAVPLLEEALELTRRAHTLPHSDVAAAMANLANNNWALGIRRQEALRLQEEALALVRITMSPEHPNVAEALHHLANSYSELNRAEDALPLYEEFLQFARQLYPPGDLRIARAMVELASTNAALTRFAEACALSMEALPILRAAHPAGHPAITLAEFLEQMGRLRMPQNRRRR